MPGKTFVTANKALLCEHGDEIFAKAREKGCCVAFEAAVAGGIPDHRDCRAISRSEPDYFARSDFERNE